MPTYHIKLTSFRISIDVPTTVRGLDNVATYITDELAAKYAHSLRQTKERVIGVDWTPEQYQTFETRMYQSYVDSHKPSIIGLLMDTRSKIQEAGARFERELLSYHDLAPYRWPFEGDWAVAPLEVEPLG
jgi:hypothetical protein